MRQTMLVGGVDSEVVGAEVVGFGVGDGVAGAVVGDGVGDGVGPVVAGAWVGDGVGDGVGPVVAGASVGTAVPVDAQQNTDVVCEHEYADGSAEQPEPAQGRVHLGQLSECSLQY